MGRTTKLKSGSSVINATFGENFRKESKFQKMHRSFANRAESSATKRTKISRKNNTSYSETYFD